MTANRIKRAFLTGGTGFVGFQVTKTLLERGVPVTVLVRPQSSPLAVQRLKSLGVKLVSGDLMQPETLSAELSNASYVFHIAAIHKVWHPDPTTLFKVNVEGTQRLLDASVQHGVEQFVYTSSVKTIGLAGNGAISNEGTPYNLWNTDGNYGRSKYLAEKLLIEANEGISIKILNPAAVIGPGDLSGTPTMDLIDRFIFGKLRISLDTRMGLVDVRDVGLAHYLALSRAEPKKKYILCAGNFYMNELFARLTKLSSCKLPSVQIPYFLAYSIAYLSTGWSTLTGRAPVIVPESLAVAGMRPGYDGSKAAQELGFTYMDVQQSLADSVEWLRKKREQRIENAAS